MANKLTQEEMDNITKLSNIGKCADLLAQIAYENEIDVKVASSMVIAIAEKKLTDLKAKAITDKF